MKIFLYILFLIIGFIMLVKGSEYFVEGAVGVAMRFGIPQLIIGLTIVAMGTSFPEAAVSITAAFSGNADITIGNVVGSNILNVFIILGISSVIVPIAVAKSTIKYEIPYMIVSSVFLLILGCDGKINLIDGILLWSGFIAYLTYLYICSKKNKEKTEGLSYVKGWKQFLYVVGGIVVIVLGSKISVYGATEIARFCGISERFIGLTIVALGTSLPELFTSVTAAKRGNEDIAIGNIVGSNIFNILFIVGTTAFVTNVTFASKFIIDTIIAITSGIILFLCVIRRKMLTKVAGMLMLACYALYFAYLCVV